MLSRLTELSNEVMKSSSCLMLFRRDLRLEDNLTLYRAVSDHSQVIPCFILDKHLLKQLDKQQPRVGWLVSSLRQLDQSLQKQGSHLHVLYDEPVSALQQLLKASDASAVYAHRDFSAYARRRDERLKTLCEQQGIPIYFVDDVTLNPPEHTCKADGTPYTIFTPFYRNAAQMSVSRPVGFSGKSRLTTLAGDYGLSTALLNAGMEEIAISLPKLRATLQAVTELRDYSAVRDYPALDRTSHLSAVLRFGLISCRGAWWHIADTLGPGHPLLRQLYWRDFFYSIAYFFPRVFNGTFHQRYNALRWPNAPDYWDAWCEARTGFPIVDAGMRELRETGFMHNRVRMVAASFLVKDLHCNWQRGAQLFADQLADYDPCINNGNWQWAASTGCDAQPYFRIFNPWTQQQKFDVDAEYIKRWLPELKKIPAKTLHHLFKLEQAAPGYVQPIVDHGTQSRLAKKMFEDVRG